MLRFSLISLLLICVLSIGIPEDNPLKDFSYSFLKPVGLDVSMTPITFDMSMMTDHKGQLVYEKVFDVVIDTGSEAPQVIKVKDLHFYRHKVPINLFFEILGYGGILPEGKEFLCRSLSEFSNKRLSGFTLVAQAKNEVSRGFNEFQHCL
jgi:hypothetical protein